MVASIIFIVFISFSTIVSSLAYFKAKPSAQDYYMASGSVGPYFVALSAVSTTNSGYMFTGMIGFAYVAGMKAFIIILMFILGDFLASFFAHRRMRITAERESKISYSGIISTWHGTQYHKFRFVAGIITFIFLSIYAGSQFSAASKAISVVFDWHLNSGILLAACLTIIYCLSGGIRASIWSDCIQAITMIVGMGLMLIVGSRACGGFDQIYNHVSQIPHYMDILPTSDSNISPYIYGTLFILSWFLGGIGVIGQPHVMSRFMTMNNPKDIFKIRICYSTIYLFFAISACIIGAMSRILIPLDIDAGFDPETAISVLAMKIMPEFLTGIIVCAVFASAISTADSQILCCSAALNSDIKLQTSLKKTSQISIKIKTILCIALSATIALCNFTTIFWLAMSAWGCMSAAFIPIIVCHILNIDLSERECIYTAIAGATIALSMDTFIGAQFIFSGGISCIIVSSALCIYKTIKTKMHR